MFLEADECIELNCSVGDDSKQMEAEMRRKYDLLAAKYKDQFVREVISNKGTEQVSIDILVLYFLLNVHFYYFLLLWTCSSVFYVVDSDSVRG